MVSSYRCIWCSCEYALPHPAVDRARKIFPWPTPRCGPFQSALVRRVDLLVLHGGETSGQSAESDPSLAEPFFCEERHGGIQGGPIREIVLLLLVAPGGTLGIWAGIYLALSVLTLC